jgi:hypothetical protein
MRQLKIDKLERAIASALQLPPEQRLLAQRLKALARSPQLKIILQTKRGRSAGPVDKRPAALPPGRGKFRG